jgi:glutamate carboxypeptidase
MPVISAQTITSYLDSRREEMTRFLAHLVSLESPTDDPLAQRPVFDFLGEALRRAGMRVSTLPGRSSGGQLYAARRQRGQGRPVQLLLGHTDTVWPLGTLANMPVEIRDGKLFGPGAFDMKGGITHIVFALQALHDLGLEPAVEPVVFLNSDEEVGSADSRRYIRLLARAAQRTFVLEPALGPDGCLKTARKGGGRFTVSITGRSAHAGLDPGAGASAIVELAHVIQSLHALNDVDRGITVNVGTIEGGSRPNVIAPSSRAVVDVRVVTHDDAREVEERIARLAPATPNVQVHVEGSIGRPPMEATPRNRALWYLAREAAAAIGMELNEAMAGGASDGNETSQYSATLDGLGSVGAGAHAAHEHVELRHMVPRTTLLALLLLAEPRPHPEASPATRSVVVETSQNQLPA